MPDTSILHQLKINAVAIISLVVAVVGLGYSTYRNERTEYNRNVRVAAFETLKNLGELQILVEYAYFHKLYLLTRTRLPRGIVRALARSRLVRRHPRLLDPLLSKTLPFFYLDNGALNLRDATLATLDEQGRASTQSLGVRAAA